MLSQKTLKCLENNIGQNAAREIYNIIADLEAQVEVLKKTKVDVTPIIKNPRKENDAII
jgi:hypothetical protein